MSRITGFLCILGLFFLVNCGGGTDVTTVLKTVSTDGRVALERASGDVTSNLTIASLKIPIRDVSLGTGDTLSGGAGNANTAYVCSGSTASDCMVELVGTALENLFVSSTGNNVGSIDPATYTSVMIATCWEEGSYQAQIKASVEIGGNTYYTKTGEGYMTTTQADWSPVTVTFNGCRNYSVLDTPITIGTTAATVSLYIDLRNVAFAATNDGANPTSLSCSISEEDNVKTAPYICLDYPNVAGSINATEPTLERYRIQGTGVTNAAKIIGLYFDPDSDLPIGGYMRQFYDNTYFSYASIFSSFKRAYMDGDNLVVTDYGSTTDTIQGNGDQTIGNFPRLAVGASQENVVQVDSEGTATGTTLTITRLD